MTETKAGRYYAKTDRGLVPVGDVGERPAVVICRRLADFAPSPIPKGAGRSHCTQCGAAIAFNPAGPHPDVPKVCLQCAEIEPLPIE